MFLLIRTVFGLLSVDHTKFSNQPHLLYSLEVLPELLALYIVAFPGFVRAVGLDALETVGSSPTGTASVPLQGREFTQNQGSYGTSPAGYATAPPAGVD